MPEKTAKLRGKVEILPLERVKPNGWNPNEMDPHTIEATRHGFKVDGWLVSQALLIWGSDEKGRAKNLIIDGEHRWVIARELGMNDGPMVVLERISEDEARALTVKLNNKRGRWNEEKLSTLLDGLRGGIDVELMPLEFGFAPDDMSRLLKPTTGPDLDKISLPDGNPIADPAATSAHVVAEIRMTPELAKTLVPELKALVKRYPDASIGIA